jgi:hypothetical protein
MKNGHLNILAGPKPNGSSIIARSAVAFTLLLAATHSTPREAHALDLTSYINASSASSQARMYQAQMLSADTDKERESAEVMYQSAKQRATGWLLAGLAIDGLTLIILAAGGGMDRVERLETELANGGGPMLDAYASGFSVPKSEVMTAVAVSLDAYQAHQAAPLAGDLDLSITKELAAHVRVTNADAGKILFGFYEERDMVGVGRTPCHDRLAALSGVPVSELSPTVAAAIDEYMAGAAAPGKVLSARTVLATDASSTLRMVLDEVFGQHTDLVNTHIEGLAKAL